MIHLDMRTVVFVAAITYLICTVFVVQLWWQNRGRFGGMDFLAINFVLQTVGLSLIVSRGAIPDWISIFVANALTMTGALLSYIGLEIFLRKPGPQLHNYLLLAATSLGIAFFSLVHPDLPNRTLIIAVFFLIVCGQCVWLLWDRVEPALRPLAFGTGLVFAGYCLLNIVRIAGYFVAAPGPEDYFQSGAFQALIIVAYQILLILLTYSLVLMVNRRLVLEIMIQQKKFASAFESAPFAITLTRLSDGMIVDVNQEFEAITGYARADVVGRSTIDMRIWERDEDRAAVSEILARDGKVRAREMNFRTKSGATLATLVSADILLAEGERHALSCILDITERKQTATALLESEVRRETETVAALEAQRQGRVEALKLMDEANAARAAADATLVEVRQQADALRQRNEQLDRFNRLAVNRELDMISLKRQVNALSLQLGLAAPFDLAFADVPQNPISAANDSESAATGAPR